MKTTAMVLFLVVSSYLECVAGTTGVLNGYVRDRAGQPVANEHVTAVSRSETCMTSTDTNGFFVCMTLPPDVYYAHADNVAAPNAFSTGLVRMNSDQTTFVVLRPNANPRCGEFSLAPLDAAPFTSLDVPRMAEYPRNAAQPIALPMFLTPFVTDCIG